jgi:hypothetical protein
VTHRLALQRLGHQPFDQQANHDDHQQAGKQAAVKGQASAPRRIKWLYLRSPARAASVALQPIRTIPPLLFLVTFRSRRSTLTVPVRR